MYQVRYIETLKGVSDTQNQYLNTSFIYQLAKDTWHLYRVLFM